MGRIKYIELSECEHQALEREYRKGKTHSYRQRCKGVLLKSERQTSAEVARQLDCNQVTVNVWLKRYEQGVAYSLHIAFPSEIAPNIISECAC